MSAINKKTQIKQSANNTSPCCKVCLDAGKPEEIYKGHYVKDNNGKVICPTLLSLECRYCYKKGHTVSHCQTLKSNQKDKIKAEKKNQILIQQKENQEKKSQKDQIKINKYAVFDDSDSDDEEVIDKEDYYHDKEYPALCGEIKKNKSNMGITNQPLNNSYANMAAKTIEEFESEQFEKNIKKNALKKIPINSTYIKKETQKSYFDVQIQEMEDPEYEEEFEEPEEYIIPSSPVDTPPPSRQRLPYKASELNWAMTEDSDDEDW
jgi:hypothetical protein